MSDLEPMTWFEAVCSNPGDVPGSLRVDQHVWMSLEDGGYLILVNDHLVFRMSDQEALDHFDLLWDFQTQRYIRGDQRHCQEMFLHAQEACLETPVFTQLELDGVLETLWTRKYQGEYQTRMEMVLDLQKHGAIKDGITLDNALGWARLNTEPLINPGDRGKEGGKS